LAFDEESNIYWQLQTKVILNCSISKITKAHQLWINSLDVQQYKRSK